MSDRFKYPKPKRTIETPVFECCGREFKGKNAYRNHLSLVHNTTDVIAEVEEIIEAEAEVITEVETVQEGV